MSRRKVREVMTADAVAVAEDTPIRDVAAVITATGFGALPVLDPAGRLTGLITAAQVLPPGPAGHHSFPQRNRWRRHRSTQAGGAGQRARDVMTASAEAIPVDASVAAAARSMERGRTSWLPVTDSAGYLVGIVSWGDLGRVFLRPDRDIQYEIIRDVFTRYLGTNPALVQVDVTGGRAVLAGVVEGKSMIPLAVAMCRAIDGVVDVVSYLSYAVDDIPHPPVHHLTGS
ncbi:MAG TPA: CBS domain-containing protein [Streptosporangiaceae bacterium]